MIQVVFHPRFRYVSPTSRCSSQHLTQHESEPYERDPSFSTFSQEERVTLEFQSLLPPFKDEETNLYHRILKTKRFTFLAPRKRKGDHLLSPSKEESQHSNHSPFHCLSWTKRLISSTASQRRRDSLFDPPARGKVLTKLKRY